MSLKGVLKSIHSILDVLESASTEQVKAWDREALENAFRWTEFAEKISEQAKGKEYKETLDRYIGKLGRVKVWQLGSCSFNLTLLETSKLRLVKALVQNPDLPQDLFACVLRREILHSAGKDTALQLLHQICEERSLMHHLFDVMRTVTAGTPSVIDRDGKIHEELRTGAPCNLDTVTDQWWREASQELLMDVIGDNFPMFKMYLKSLIALSNNCSTESSSKGFSSEEDFYEHIKSRWKRLLDHPSLHNCTKSILNSLAVEEEAEVFTMLLKDLCGGDVVQS